MGVIGRLRGRRDASDVEGRIRSALRELRPLVGSHAERIDLLEYAPATGVATLIVEGWCPDCDMPAAALLQGIGAHLRVRVPEVRDVRAADTH
jgi:Fe-S cluster biogenesis protein NfuA